MSLTANTQQSDQPRLKKSWIEKIFAQLQGRFGNSFTNKYATGQILEDGFDKNGKPIEKDLGLENAKAVWAVQLAHLSPEDIIKGLETNYTYPPSCDDFVRAAQNMDYETLFHDALRGHTARRSNDSEFNWVNPVSYWASIEFGVFDLFATTYEKSKARWQHCINNAMSKKSVPVPPIPEALPPPEHTRDSPIAKEVVGRVLKTMSMANGREYWMNLIERDDFDSTPAVTKQFAIDTLKKLNMPLPEKLKKYVHEGLKL